MIWFFSYKARGRRLCILCRRLTATSKMSRSRCCMLLFLLGRQSQGHSQLQFKSWIWKRFHPQTSQKKNVSKIWSWGPHRYHLPPGFILFPLAPFSSAAVGMLEIDKGKRQQRVHWSRAVPIQNLSCHLGLKWRRTRNWSHQGKLAELTPCRQAQLENPDY